MDALGVLCVLAAIALVVFGDWWIGAAVIAAVVGLWLSNFRFRRRFAKPSY